MGSLLLIGKREPPVARTDGDEPRMLRQIRQGLRHVIGHPLLRPLAVCTATLTCSVQWGRRCYNVNGRSLAQSIAPPAMLGRTIATNRFIVWGVIPLGSFVGTVLGTSLGLRPTLWIVAAGELAAFVAPALSAVRTMILMPDQLRPSPLGGSPSPSAILSVTRISQTR